MQLTWNRNNFKYIRYFKKNAAIIKTALKLIPFESSFNCQVCIYIYIYIYIYICMCVCLVTVRFFTMWSLFCVRTYITYNKKVYISVYKLKNQVIQSGEFNMKESQCYNVSVLINHHQDLEKMLSSVIRSPMDV